MTLRESDSLENQTAKGGVPPTMKLSEHIRNVSENTTCSANHTETTKIKDIIGPVYLSLYLGQR